MQTKFISCLRTPLCVLFKCLTLLASPRKSRKRFWSSTLAFVFECTFPFSRNFCFPFYFPPKHWQRLLDDHLFLTADLTFQFTYLITPVRLRLMSLALVSSSSFPKSLLRAPNTMPSSLLISFNCCGKARGRSAKFHRYLHCTCM